MVERLGKLIHFAKSHKETNLKEMPESKLQS